MIIVKWLMGVVGALGLAVLVAGQFGLFRGTAPSDLGVRNGRLKPPAQTPNSVSSQAALYPEHPQRASAQIAPLALVGDGPATLAKIKVLAQARANVAVVKSEPDYLCLQYSSQLMNFVDDVEFWFDPANRVVQVRSASRVGKGDMGVNRARIESMRAELSKASP